MSVFNTDSVTIVRKKGDWFLSASVKPKALITFIYQISFAIPIKMLSFVTETAAVQAQEQRAKDAKSFRRLNASDYNSMLIS